MLKVGITGGIGSGKSRVSDLLRARGYAVYDCDSEAKRLMLSDAGLQKALEELAGCVLFSPESGFDRKALAAFMFSCPENVAAVNALVHPAVRMDFAAWASAQEGDMCFMESAILFESGFDGAVDVIVSVDAPDEVRIARAMMRDGSSREAVVERMRAQWGRQQRNEASDYVLDNGGGLEMLEEETGRMLDRLVSNNR